MRQNNIIYSEGYCEHLPWEAFKNIDVQTSPRPIKLEISELWDQDQKSITFSLRLRSEKEGELKCDLDKIKPTFFKGESGPHT